MKYCCRSMRLRSLRGSVCHGLVLGVVPLVVPGADVLQRLLPVQLATSGFGDVEPGERRELAVPSDPVARRRREVDVDAAHRVDDLLEAGEVDFEIVSDGDVVVRFQRLDHEFGSAVADGRVDAAFAVAGNRDPEVARERDDEAFLEIGVDVHDHDRVGSFTADLRLGTERALLLLVGDEVAAVGPDDEEVCRLAVVDRFEHFLAYVHLRDVFGLLPHPVVGARDHDRGRHQDQHQRDREPTEKMEERRARDHDGRSVLAPPVRTRAGERALFDREAEAARDQQPLDLARALADLEDLRVPIEARHRRLVDIAVAAVDLHRVASRAHRDLARVELGHRGEVAERPALIPQRRGLVHKVSGILDGHRHVGALERDRLVAPDRAAEGVARAGVLHRHVEARLRQPDRERGDRDPTVVEDAQKRLEAFAARPSNCSSGTRQPSKTSSCVSEACQPIFRYAGITVNPGVPASTTTFEISFGPVRAVIVTHFVIGVPELVMKVFWPSITHSPAASSRVARVLVAPTSEPASASVRPNAPSTSPSIIGTRYSCFCISVPE